MEKSSFCELSVIAAMCIIGDMTIRSLNIAPVFKDAMTVLAICAGLAFAADAVRADDVVNPIDQCVAAESEQGGSGVACVGLVVDPCRKDPGNQTPEEQIECFQSEFVEWHLMLKREYAAIRDALDTPEKKAKLKLAQDRWVAFHKADCRLPYAMFDGKKADHAGPDCSIRRTAQRALDLRRWRLSLTAR